MEKQLLISVMEQKRDVDARKLEISVGDKRIQCPALFPQIKNPHDYDVLFHDDFEKNRVEGYVLPIYLSESPPILRKRANAHTRTFSADGSWEKTLDPALLLFESTKLILVDPMTEYYYYNAKKSLFQKISNKPETARILFSGSNEDHNGNWSRIVDEGRMLELQNWNIKMQRKAMADVVIPSTPIMHSTTPHLLDVAIKANRSAELSAASLGLSKSQCAHHYVFSDSFFEDSELVEEMIDALLDAYLNEKTIKFLSYKIMNESISDNHVQRENYSNFLSALNSIRSESNLVVVMLNAGTTGFVSLARGVDIMSEPMDGETQDRRGWGKGGTYRKGKWYSPSTKTMWKWPEAEKFRKINGVYPGEGKYAQTASTRGSVDDLTWNTEMRRKHLIEERSIEITQLMEAIDSQDVQHLRHRMLESEVPNLAKLL